MEKYIELKFVDCWCNEIIVKIDESKLENMAVAFYEIISGDEVLTITYKNGEEETYDTSDCRIMSFHGDKINLLNKQELLLINKLKTHYSYDRAEKLQELVNKLRKD